MLRIAFVGGVHGVGKSSMCAAAAREIGATHLMASSLIREANQEAISGATKRSPDVQGNQELLVKRFFERTSSCLDLVILDGHYTLLNWQGEPVRLDAALFARLGVSTFLCVRGDTEAIAARLVDRDGHGPSAEEVAVHQQVELDHAADVARYVGTQVQMVEAFDTQSLVAALAR